MAGMKKGIFIAIVVMVGGYVLLCLGLYEWSLRARPDAFRTPPAVLPPALVEQVAAMEGLGQQAMPRLDPITMLPRSWLGASSQQQGSDWQRTIATTSQFRAYRPGDQIPGTRRHFAEMADAVFLSRHWTREQVLSARANVAYYGRDALGLDAAAQAWYGMPLTQLRSAEITALWTLQWAPSSLDPFCRRDGFAQHYATLAKRVPGLDSADTQSATERMSASVCR